MRAERQDDIWIVEDNPMYAKTVEQGIINRFQCKTQTFHSIGKLISNIDESNYPRILILDYWMEKGTADRILAYINLLDLPIKTLILSGETDKEIIEHLFNQGIFDYVQKGDDEHIDIAISLKTLLPEHLTQYYPSNRLSGFSHS